MTPIQLLVCNHFRGGEFLDAPDDARILRDPFLASVFLELGDAGREDALIRLGDMIRDLTLLSAEVAALD